MLEEASLKEILVEPKTLEDLHIPESIIIDLILRLLFNEGNVSLSRFVEVIRVSNSIADKMLLWLQKERLVDVSKTTGELGRLGYVYTLTDAGEKRARDSMDRSQYVGPAPVPIHFYNRGIELQTEQTRQVTARQVIDALKFLVLPSNFHRRIGPAINSGSSLFLYGPPGNGKTRLLKPSLS